MRELTGAGQVAPEGLDENGWVEHLRRPDLSVGTYVIEEGGTDGQTPHTEDEIYVITSGEAKLTGPEGSIPVRPGSVVFVPANEEHRFEDIRGTLATLVVFAPAEYTRDLNNSPES